MGTIGVPDPSEITRNEMAAFAVLGLVVLSGLLSVVLPAVIVSIPDGGTLSGALRQVYTVTRLLDDALFAAVLFGLWLAFYYIPGKSENEAEA